MSIDSLRWFAQFRLWFAVRSRAEFSDVDWTFHIDQEGKSLQAGPSQPSEFLMTWNLPSDCLIRDARVLAGQVATDLRIVAEEQGLVPRRRTASAEWLMPTAAQAPTPMRAIV